MTARPQETRPQETRPQETRPQESGPRERGVGSEAAVDGDPGAAFELTPFDADAADAARERLDRLTKPPGSLGRLEELAVQLCGIAGQCPPPLPRPAGVAVFAGDHGVLAEGVSPWPAEVTAQMVHNFLGGGAAINVFARMAGATVEVIDVGVATQLSSRPGLTLAKVRPGTGNLRVEDAMTLEEARAALEVGAAVARRLVAAGATALVTGDMGIANTTPSAALVAAFTGRDVESVTGRGTGIDEPTWRKKVDVVADGLRRAGLTGPEVAAAAPLQALAAVGGLEQAALAGFCLAGAAARVPVVLDGVIAVSAALVARALVPDVVDFLVAGHRSSEPGATVGLDHLGLRPLLELELRLGEGTGGALALPLLEAAARVLVEMATFAEAAVTDVR